jgi:hypothetical protein
MAASDEFFAADSREPGTFIWGVYQTVLGRTPSTAGVNGWLGVHQRASLTSTLSIVVRASGLTASQQQVLQQAAQRWEQLMVGDLPDATYWGVAVDDLLIDASVTSIDGPGGRLGDAGRDAIRLRSGLPVHGTMEFYLADMATLEARPTRLRGVARDEPRPRHRHYLRWHGPLSGAGTTDPRLLGLRATAEYDAIFHVNATSVPVEGRPSLQGSRLNRGTIGTRALFSARILQTAEQR